MNALKTYILCHTKLVKGIIFCFVTALCLALVACIGLWIYQYYFVQQVHTDFAAKVENVKAMARHNALQIVDEAIYTDTINGISEVYSVKARITVQYDLENMKYRFEGDTLLVELPREIIQSHELQRRLLDEYYTDGKWHMSRPTISGKQTNEIERRMKQFVHSTMVNQQHIKQARQIELTNMVRLLRTISPKVKVVINIDQPTVELNDTILPMPCDV